MGTDFRAAGRKNLGEKQQETRVTFHGKSVAVLGGLYTAKSSTQLRLKRSCFRAKKKASRVLLHAAGSVRSQGLLCCDGIDFGASGSDI